MSLDVVAVFGASRADLYPLQSVLSTLSTAPDLDPLLISSGTTANPAFGDPLSGIAISGVRAVSVAADAASSDYPSMASAGAKIARELPQALMESQPAAFVVLGDRWELLYAVPPALLMGIPIVHLHGGEVTEGAVDDRIRHAMTKLADLHCVSTPDAAARLRQLGEPSDRIFVTGAPSLDRLSTVRPATAPELESIIGFPVKRPLALVTYHPVTAGGSAPGAAARQLLEVLVRRVGTVLVTHPGLDAGREEIVEAIEAAAEQHANVAAVQSLGPDYLPILAASDVVVGNSSSGIIEAASFGVPVVNVGERQRGRTSGINVIDADESAASIMAAVDEALSPSFKSAARAAPNIYGDGMSATRVLRVIRQAVRGGLARKHFSGLPVGTEG